MTPDPQPSEPGEAETPPETPDEGEPESEGDAA